MENQKINVGDLIRFRFEVGGKVQHRLVTISQGKFNTYDLEACCFCHRSESLEGLLERYCHFEDFTIIKRSEWSVFYTIDKLF